MRPASSVSAPSIASSTATGPISPVPRRAKPRSAWVIAPIRSVTPTISRRFAARLAGLAGVEQPRAGLGIGADRGERLVDLVRDAGRDLAEDRQPVRLGQLVAQAARARVSAASRSAISPASAAFERLSSSVRSATRCSSSAFIAASAACRASAQRRRRSSREPAERQQQPGEQRRDLRAARRGVERRLGRQEGGEPPVRAPTAPTGAAAMT